MHICGVASTCGGSDGFQHEMVAILLRWRLLQRGCKSCILGQLNAICCSAIDLAYLDIHGNLTPVSVAHNSLSFQGRST